MLHSHHEFLCRHISCVPLNSSQLSLCVFHQPSSSCLCFTSIILTLFSLSTSCHPPFPPSTYLLYTLPSFGTFISTVSPTFSLRDAIYLLLISFRSSTSPVLSSFCQSSDHSGAFQAVCINDSVQFVHRKSRRGREDKHRRGKEEQEKARCRGKQKLPVTEIKINCPVLTYKRLFSCEEVPRTNTRKCAYPYQNAES